MLKLSTEDFTDTGGGRRDSFPKINPEGEIIGNRQNLIEPFFISHSIHVKVRFNRLLVEYSPSTYKSGGKHNLLMPPAEEIKQQLKEIQANLLKFGIGVDLLNTDLTRIDVALDREMDHSFRYYKDTFRSLQFNSSCRKDCGSTVYIQNGWLVLTFYFKTKELKDHKKRIPDSLFHKNLIRCELRLKKKAKIKSVCATARAGEVLDSLSKIEAVFLKTLKRGFFR